MVLAAGVDFPSLAIWFPRTGLFAIANCKAPALATLSTSCLFCWTTRANGMGPPAGVAPARLLYKRNPQAAAWRRIGRHASASQSPVLPRTQRAYETHLSAGSTAKLEP